LQHWQLHRAPISLSHQQTGACTLAVATAPNPMRPPLFASRLRDRPAPDRRGRGSVGFFQFSDRRSPRITCWIYPCHPFSLAPARRPWRRQRPALLGLRLRIRPRRHRRHPDRRRRPRAHGSPLASSAGITHATVGARHLLSCCSGRAMRLNCTAQLACCERCGHVSCRLAKADDAQDCQAFLATKEMLD